MAEPDPEPTTPGWSRPVLDRVRSWWGTDPGAITRADGWAAILSLLLLALAFAAAAFEVERALGDPVLSARLPGGSKSLDDALWHLATGFLIAIPTRRWLMLLIGPVLALGIDTDHLFGTVLPTVVDREAHNLLFLLLLGLLLAQVRGRSAAFAGVGFAALHIGVDGGSFPLLAPFTTATWGLPLPVAAAVIAGASLMVFLSVRPLRELRRPAVLIPWIAVVVAVIVLLPIIPGNILVSGAGAPVGY